MATVRGVFVVQETTDAYTSVVQFFYNS